jgi:Bacterial regulatory proteins, luxR family
MCNPRVAHAASWRNPTVALLGGGGANADGLSNREIGQQLHLSHRTVSSYLYRAFPKLGISSRAQLRTVLDDRTTSLA